MISKLRFALIALLVLAASKTFAQAPNISYPTPQVYKEGFTIDTLKPTNTGGAVPSATPLTLKTGLNGARGVAIDASGNIFISEISNNDIKEITPAGAVTIVVTGLSTPNGVAVDGSDNLYIVNTATNSVVKALAGSKTFTTYATGFNAPFGIAIDASGNLYVGDENNAEVKEIPAGGGTPVVIGSGFTKPAAVAVDAAGNVYVSDVSTSTIKKITAGNGAVTTLGTTTGACYGIAVDAVQNVYYTVVNSTTITEIPASGSGPIALGAGLDAAYGIVVDPQNNLFLTDDRPGSGNTLLELPFGGYKISPSLPSGLSLNMYTGNITGKADVTSPATNYLITAYNLSGTSNATVNITVKLPAKPAISYPSPQVYYNGIAITPLTPTNTGDAGSWTVSPALPSGLSFSSTTGVISGTPTAVTAAANYTITASNDGGHGTFVLNITVDPTPKPVISYTTPDVFTAGQTITPLSPTSTGGPIPSTSGTYKISPVLPSGLSINSGTGIISGTPSSAKAATNYTVTATNSGGSGTTVINITVNLPPPPAISYASPQVFTVNQAITPVTPTSTGGPIPSTGAYTISPALSAGLAFNAVTGTISGTPTAANPATNYTITASNDGGTGTATINITVNLPAKPVISYSSPQIYSVGTAISPLTPVNSGGAIIVPVVTTYASGLNGGPYDITLDSKQNIYINEDGNLGDVKEFPAGGGGPIERGQGYAGAQGLAVDSDLNIYVSDGGNDQIVRLAPSDTPFQGYGLGSGFVNPWGLALDKAGNLFIADNGNHAVKEMPNANGSPGTVGTPVVIASSPTFSPESLAIDASDNVYVVDGTTATIQKIVAGSGVAVPFIKGFGNPQCIAVDAQGDIFFTDSNYPSVLKLPAGTNGGFISIGSGLASPHGVYADASGKIWVTDGGSIKEITPGNFTISPNLPAGLTFDTYTGTISGTPTVTSPATNYTVTAVNAGGTGTTTVNITVGAAATGLAALTISSGTLSPAFATATPHYSVTEAYTVSSVTLTPTTSDPSYTVTVNGTAVTSGSPSAAIPLAVGANNISIVVKSSGGTVIGTYTVAATRTAASTDATLSSFTVSKGTLSPAFASNTTSYTDMVTNGTTSVTVKPVATSPTATIKVNGTPVSLGGSSAPIALSVGSNPVTVVVTAQDGSTTLTYTVNVIRPSMNDKLAGLAISYGSLTPAFNTNTTSYSEFVPYSVATMTITPTVAVTGSTVTVNGVATASGSASTPVALAVGTTVINTVVTAQDGVTTNTYSLTVTRPAGSTNANLSALTVSKGTLTPAFNTSTITYSDMVTNGTTSLTITPTLSNVNATMTVNGTAVASGHASGPMTLAVGSNVVTILVTAQNGTNTKTYKVTVIRPSTNAKLAAFTISSGTLTPAFNTNTTTYTASVTNATSSITVTPTVAVTGATVKVNGTAVASGSSSGAIALTVGSNTITTVVTAQDGSTTDTYTLTVTRAAGPENIPDAAVGVGVQNFEPLLTFEDGINVHQGISPNGDGINDFLQIDNISNYPENHLSIMNRNGQLVYESKGYDNATKVFDGHSNKTGQMQLPGTYFYSLDYTVKGIVKHKTGFLVLKY